MPKLANVTTSTATQNKPTLAEVIANLEGTPRDPAEPTKALRTLLSALVWDACRAVRRPVKRDRSLLDRAESLIATLGKECRDAIRTAGMPGVAERSIVTSACSLLLDLTAETDGRTAAECANLYNEASKALEQLHDLGDALVSREQPPVPKSPDGPTSGRWVHWQGKRYDVPQGVVYRLIAYMWNRDVGNYNDMMDDIVFESSVESQTIRARVSDANKSLKMIGIPWRLSADSVNRNVTKSTTTSPRNP